MTGQSELVICVSEPGSIYKLQDEGYFFSSIESFLRKLNPELFTYSRLDLEDIVQNKCQDSSLAKSLVRLVNKCSHHNANDILPGIVGNEASSLRLEQTSVSVHFASIQGLSALVNNWDSAVMVIDNRKLCETIVESCKLVRLKLNCQVKLVAINDRQTLISNKLKYELNGQLLEEQYDYVVIAFPLIKDAIKDNSFYLDILNKNYLNFEMSFMNSYLVNGRATPRFMRVSSDVHLMAICLDSSKVIVEIMRHSEEKCHRISLLCWLNGLRSEDEKALDCLFEPDYQVIDRVEMDRQPLFAHKTRRALLGFPQIVIDDTKRSRIYHLNSFEWIFGSMSKECNCIAARNISLLIGQKELTKPSSSSACQLSVALRRFYRSNFLATRLRVSMISIRFLISYLFRY